MQSTQFQFQGATYRVIEDTVKTDILSEHVAYLIHPTPSLVDYRLGKEYGVFLATVTLLSGDPGFTLPAIEDTPAVGSFYPVFMALPGGFRQVWNTARGVLMLLSANAADLTPGIDPKKADAPPTDGDGTNSSVPSTEVSSALPAPVKG